MVELDVTEQEATMQLNVCRLNVFDVVWYGVVCRRKKDDMQNLIRKGNNNNNRIYTIINYSM